jgi:hypothetical protein
MQFLKLTKNGDIVELCNINKDELWTKLQLNPDIILRGIIEQSGKIKHGPFIYIFSPLDKKIENIALAEIYEFENLKLKVENSFPLTIEQFDDEYGLPYQFDIDDVPDYASINGRRIVRSTKARRKLKLPKGDYVYSRKLFYRHQLLLCYFNGLSHITYKQCEELISIKIADFDWSRELDGEMLFIKN